MLQKRSILDVELNNKSTYRNNILIMLAFLKLFIFSSVFFFAWIDLELKVQ